VHSEDTDITRYNVADGGHGKRVRILYYARTFTLLVKLNLGAGNSTPRLRRGGGEEAEWEGGGVAGESFSRN